MAESNAVPAEEDFSYYCLDCRFATEETEKDLNLVSGQGLCYTCTQCGNEFDAGFKRKKIFTGEEKICYMCYSCKSKTFFANCNFTFVGPLGFCFACTRCGEKLDFGFKKEQRNSSDTTSHRCDVCGKTFQELYLLLHHSYHHSKEWPFRCLVCQAGFPTPSALKIHKKKLDVMRKIQCTKCLKTFFGRICYQLLNSSTTQLYCEKCGSGPSPVQYATS